MQPFLRVVLGWAVISLVVLAVGTATGEVGGTGKKRPKGAKKKKNQTAATATPGPGGEQSLTNIPLPIGQEAKGLTLPDFDVQGRLRGKFVAGSAKRLDEEHIGFKDLKITTYTEENQPDLEIDMRTSTFDLTTKILKSDERTTVRRSDFNVAGDAAVFDTNARTSRMIGNVKMVITAQGQTHLMEKPSPTPSP